MSAVDLSAEMTLAGLAVRQAHLDRLRSFGVSTSTIAAAGLSHWPFGVIAAEPVGSGLYQPGEGQLHVVLPVVEDGVLMDLVAFRPAAPNDWLLRTGNGFALGLDRGRGRWMFYSPADPAATPPRHQVGRPLHVFSNPLDWLQGGREGLCVVDWSSPEIVQLDVFASITVSEPHIGRLLTAALTRPARLPTIELMEAAHAA